MQTRRCQTCLSLSLPALLSQGANHLLERAFLLSKLIHKLLSQPLLSLIIISLQITNCLIFLCTNHKLTSQPLSMSLHSPVMDFTYRSPKTLSRGEERWGMSLSRPLPLLLLPHRYHRPPLKQLQTSSLLQLKLLKRLRLHRRDHIMLLRFL